MMMQADQTFDGQQRVLSRAAYDLQVGATSQLRVTPNAVHIDAPPVKRPTCGHHSRPGETWQEDQGARLPLPVPSVRPALGVAATQVHRAGPPRRAKPRSTQIRIYLSGPG
jgi:hypothetical protein